ncbi:hypothetical protein WI87_00015 [Burkholderia ubonensis]|nr:hypothetical protein [Burkholderia ubonensis]KVD62459.1 hypothetical protein WI87_00015 [Burkholderia ubonensis]
MWLQPAVLSACVMSCAKRSCSMTGEPHGDETAGVEGEVQERREITEELGRQVLRLIDDPQGQDLLAVGQFGDAQLELAPKTRPSYETVPSRRTRRSTRYRNSSSSFGARPPSARMRGRSCW